MRSNGGQAKHDYGAAIIALAIGGNAGMAERRSRLKETLDWLHHAYWIREFLISSGAVSLVAKWLSRRIPAFAPYAWPVGILAVGLLMYIWVLVRRTGPAGLNGDNRKPKAAATIMEPASVPALQSKLTIKSAFYEFDSDHSENVTERVKSLPRDGLVIPVDNNTMGCDPMPNTPPGKYLRVRYTYGNDAVQDVQLPEGSRMVLPRQIERGAVSPKDSVSDSDPLVYPEFTDARSNTGSDKKENQSYLTLVNRGKAEARNIIVESIEMDGKIVQFTRHRIAASLLPKREAYFYPDVVTKDNRSVAEQSKDMFGMFCRDYLALGDSTICEATKVVVATYQDSARNLFEVTCELVFDPSAHAAVRIGNRGPSPVIFTRNHSFRKIAECLGDFV
jgi:hypothetical protein